MAERFEPTLKYLPSQDVRAYRFTRKGVGNMVFIFNPIVAFEGVGWSQKVIYCSSRNEQNCLNCPIRDLCPRPFGANSALNRIGIPLETAKKYLDNPDGGNPTITNGHPPPINR